MLHLLSHTLSVSFTRKGARGGETERRRILRSLGSLLRTERIRGKWGRHRERIASDSGRIYGCKTRILEREREVEESEGGKKKKKESLGGKSLCRQTTRSREANRRAKSAAARASLSHFARVDDCQCKSGEAHMLINGA